MADICEHETLDKPQDCRWCLRERVAALEAKIDVDCEECCGLTEAQLKELLDESRQRKERIAALEAERGQRMEIAATMAQNMLERIAAVSTEARREGARRALEWCGCAELATHVNNLDEAIDAALGEEVNGGK